MVKNPSANAGDTGDMDLILGQEDLLEVKWKTTPAFLPGKSHGQRCLAGYSPWSHKDLDMTEQLSMYIDQGRKRLMS